MTQMFCTLKQAADKLETTEAEIERMLNRGVLREYRDGSRRLLKVADLADVAVAARPSISGGDRHEAESLQAEIDKEAFTLPELEIKLPPAAAATTRVGPPAVSSRPPRPATGSGSQRRLAHAAVVHGPVSAQRRPNPPRAIVVSPASVPPRPRPQTYEMSLRQWLWAGLLDDSPFAIGLLFGIVLLGISALAGAVYLLLQLL
jgi:hypothetical protein